MKPIDLPDVNVWLALANENDKNHKQAKLYWQTKASPYIAFTRATLLGMVRLLANRVVMEGKPLSLQRAFATYQDFRALPEVIWLGEDDETALHVDETLAKWVVSNRITPRVWTDAYLASLAIAHNCRLVSFDSDFQLFKELSFLKLT